MKIISFFTTIFQVIFSLATALSLSLPGSANVEASFKAKNPDELIMSFSLVSDVHVETNASSNYKQFVKLLKGIKGGENTDAAIFLGDNVMNGQGLESYFFYTAVKKIDPAKENLVVLGNHDVGNGTGDYNKLSQRFLRFNSEYLDNPIEKTYYYKVINGCYMIFLATEDMTVNTAYITEEQYDWLSSLLAEADKASAPIFVFNHHPIFMVEQDQYALADLLNDYKNLIYFNGHTHMPLDEYSFWLRGGVNTVYLPRSIGASYPDGDGVVVEVYPNEVVIRCRNFINGTWLEIPEQTYSLDI
ncbi:MAG: hypothetical protein E7676_05705 [Ruminococcaceae bacterium]|nr:hypothetical protein [Oscillospiraceae bacterium]